MFIYNMATHDFEENIKETFNLNEVTSFQIDALNALLGKRDVFVSVKTGAGKSLCYQGFLTAFSCSSEDPCSVLVVSPLLSIMHEQCNYLEGLGFRAGCIASDSDIDGIILKNEMQFVFTSPESLLRGKWRDWITNNTTVKLIAVDEAHTVLHWGDTADGNDPFRSWYGKLGEIRSLIQCPIILLTATANLAARKELQKKFCMKDCLEIIQNPDRENIKLFLERVKCNVPLEDAFYFLITLLKQKKNLCERYLIFSPTIRWCSKIYTMLRMELKQDIKYVEMFHSKTPDNVKQLIKDDMGNPDGNIRILIATSAAGMGVNYRGLNNTINFGCPRNMDSFVQQYGRAGRDGGFAMSLLMYTNRDKHTVDSDMKLYIENGSLCRRENILSAYKSKPVIGRDLHKCCDICALKCEVKDCKLCKESQHPYYVIQPLKLSSESGEPEDIFSDSDW